MLLYIGTAALTKMEDRFIGVGHLQDIVAIWRRPKIGFRHHYSQLESFKLHELLGIKLLEGIGNMAKRLQRGSTHQANAGKWGIEPHGHVPGPGYIRDPPLRCVHYFVMNHSFCVFLGIVECLPLCRQAWIPHLYMDLNPSDG